MIEKISNSNCESFYRVRLDDGQDLVIRVWAITGGQLAISTKDHYFTKRFNYCPERDSKLSDWQQWDGVHIEHFTYGDNDIYNYVRETLPLLAIQEYRESKLPKSIKSKRFHDESNRCYFRCKWEKRRYASPITAESNVYGGRCEDIISDYADDLWIAVRDIINPICDDNNFPVLAYLDQNTFDNYLEAVKQLK